ncbi:MAG TPA: YceI family protein, partial [Chitinophagaceae bacterium]|nr:YceI family protein [Chitinophagaceae bacterium]
MNSVKEATKISWMVDPVHSDVFFKVKYLMLTTVTGYFRSFDAEALTEEDDYSRIVDIKFSAEVDSIDTNNPQRDAHLKSLDFFNAEEYKLLKFSASHYDCAMGDKLNGNLTIRNITKAVTLNIEFQGINTDGYGRSKAGFSISGKISRKEFGLT